MVRRPTGWFRALVDENERAVAPPDPLLEECTERHEQLERRGLCDEEVHNAAWEEVSFASRYRESLASDEAASAAVTDLAEESTE